MLLNPQLRLHTIIFVHVTDICQRSSETWTTTQSTHILEYCITAALDMETLPLKRGPFARIITFFLYKWLPVYSLRLFLFFLPSCFQTVKDCHSSLLLILSKKCHTLSNTTDFERNVYILKESNDVMSRDNRNQSGNCLSLNG